MAAVFLRLHAHSGKKIATQPQPKREQSTTHTNACFVGFVG